MPKFVITTDDGDGAVRHDEQIDFPSEKSATDDAQNALVDMAREKLPNGTRAEFGAKVEDESGGEIYRASLSFRSESSEQIKETDAQLDAAADDVANALRGGPKE